MRVLLILLGMAGVCSAAEVSFSRDVRPLLSDNCFACHGPDESSRMAGLRLDTQEGAAAVIVPGDAAASKLFQRVNHEQEVVRMPPPSFDRKLTPEQIKTIEAWINQGAEWESHWSYQPPRRSEAPAVSKPGRDGNAIDRFIWARLEAEGLQPSERADKAKLLRRLSFDLTGLPPTPEETEAFLADESPDAYEKLVDRLLASDALGRAPRDALARPGALRRHPRLPH